MKKFYLSILFLSIAWLSFSQVTITPFPFEVNESITITLDVNSNATDCNGLSNPSKVYMHSGIGDGTNAFGFSVIGNWGEDDGVGEMTNEGGGIFTISLVPETYYGLTPTQAANAILMGIVFRNADGTQELKANGCNDFIFEVGTFQLSLSSPTETTTILPSGSDLTINASNIGGNASYTLRANGSVINTVTFASNYSFTDTNITENKNYELVAVLDGTTITKRFSVIIDPGSNIDIMPTTYQDGITYIDDTTAILVLYATGKDFVYVAGSFNNWQPDLSYAMKRDVTRNKFWLEITGLTPGQLETYQYWVGDKTPPTDSPALVKVADPYSTLILSSFDDPFIPESTYPNLPDFPEEAEFEVTVLQTAQTPYNWQVTNFEKPKKEDLIVYEVLVRDFDADRNYQDLIDKIDYFKNLNINAIHLMPVMEFEGNESWGYNTSYHMALDKYYGTEDKLKEFIDLCHQNDIAVILDLVLNHAFGRSPMVRMWMDDPDGNGFGDPTSENPYFNMTPRHSYNVGYDYNHQNPRVQDYVKRVIKHWVEDFNIDGFRWDLTKGFTQNCTANDEGCTNAYQQDRVDVLKDYANYSWSLDDTHYVIFEHLGTDNEEQQWANHRIDEGKGIMLWGKMTDQYNELTMGQNGNKNINRMGHVSRGFNAPRLMGYPESHDEERLMFKNLQFGNTSNSIHNVQDLNTALSRMSALAAVSVMVPGPKMIWHFGDLGMENSIFTCNNGTVNLPGDGDGNGDCKLDTKPQPQWANNWLTDAIRGQIYADWSRLHALKINEPVFEGDYTIDSGDFTPRIDIFDASIPTSELRNVIILANFDVTTQSVNTNFPTGVTSTWYDLMDPSGSTTIANSTTSISIPAGQFRILGNAQAQALSIDEEALLGFSIYPNPTTTSFSVNTPVSDIEIYDLTGKLVKSFKGDFNKTDAFDISGLNTGMYIVKVENNNNQIKTTKLVKL
jgi:1,4-alpha-glucan branching enzyme